MFLIDREGWRDQVMIMPPLGRQLCGPWMTAHWGHPFWSHMSSSQEMNIKARAAAG